MAYPIQVGFYFEVDFGFSGENEVAFQEVGGLTVEITTEEYREGGLNQYSHRLPTGVKFGNLILKRAMFKDSRTVQWCKDAIDNFIFDPRPIMVTLLDLEGEQKTPLVQWSFQNAYPVKWVISDFKSQDSTLVIETLELAYSRFERKT